MNKKELQKQANGLPSTFTLLDKRVLVDKSAILGLIDQLDESQKVVVPKFVAEWIEKCKADEECLSFAIGNHIPHDVSNWLALNDCKNEDLFARVWLDGYEVEQEKLYTVEIPNPFCTFRQTHLTRENSGIVLVKSDWFGWKNLKENKLTEAEIKKDFEWAWQFAEEVKE